MTLRHAAFLVGAWLLCLASGSARPLSEFSLVLDILVTEQGILAAGERGLLLRSEDDGRLWAPVKSPVTSTLTCLAIGSGDRRWAAGHEGALLRSDDAGRSWISVSTSSLHPDDAVFGLQVESTGAVTAWGAFGLLLRSSEDGESWARLTSPVGDLHLYAAAQPKNKLSLFGEAGAAIGSSPRGDWVALPIDGAPSFHGALSLRNGNVLAFGLRGRAFHTDPAMKTWRELTTGSEGLLAAGIELPRGEVLLAGQTGTWLLSRDAGETWHSGSSPYPGAISCLRLSREGALLIAGEVGVRRIDLKEVLP